MSCASAGLALPREQCQRFRVHDLRFLGSRADHSVVSHGGWGGRIRTSEWRDQNPLPYHLATPQQSSARAVQINRAAASHRSADGERFSPRATKLFQRSGTRAAMRSASSARSKPANMQAPVPLMRAATALPCASICARSQSSACATSGSARAYYRLEHIDGAAFGKGAYCDDGRISCQFRGLEHLSGIHADSGVNHQKPASRQLHGSQPLAATLPPGGAAVNEHRHVRPQRDAELRKLGQAEIAPPERIERQQDAGGIRAAAAEPAAGRNMFNDMDVGTQGASRCAAAARGRRALRGLPLATTSGRPAWRMIWPSARTASPIRSQRSISWKIVCRS